MSRLFTRTLLRYVTLTINTLPPLPNKKMKFYDLKRIGVEVKKSPSSFICFNFQLSTNSTKKKICLKIKTCHYCQSLVQTSSMPSKTGVPLSWIQFEYNSKFKYTHSNLRVKHYLHYKVRRKGTNKSYKTCYFGLHIPYMHPFL